MNISPYKSSQRDYHIRSSGTNYNFCDLNLFECLGCGQEIEGKIVGASGYHSYCYPCDGCGKAREEGGYVIPFTGYHTHCLPCQKCGKAEENGKYVNPYTGKHFYC